jgi:uncharacterized protein (TIGR02246 family)
MIETLAMLAWLSLGQAAPAAPTAEDAVRAADAARIKAFTSADRTALGSLLGEDLTYTHSSGLLDSKAGIIDAITSGKTQYHSLVTEDVTVRLYGDVAVLTGRAAVNVTNNGQLLDLKLRFISVYVKRDGRWQFVAWQSTRMTQ